MIKKFRKLFFLSFFSFIFSGMLLFIIPFMHPDSEGFMKVIEYAASAVFWAGLFAGILFFIKMNALTKKIEGQLRQNSQKTLEKLHCGVISFFRNKYAIVADIFMFVFTVLFVVVLIADSVSDIFSISAVVLLYLSFVCHSFFNGKNFIYILKYEGYRKKKKMSVKENQKK